MGLLSRRLWPLLTLASLAACARAVPPHAIPDPAPSFDCRIARGTVRGPVLALTLPADPESALRCSIARDGQELTTFALGDVGGLPGVVEMGDATAGPGLRHEYECVLWDDSRPLSVARAQVSVPDSLPSARAPEVALREGAVLIAWSLEEAFAGAEGGDVTGTTVVFRRDVAVDDELVAISPYLRGAGWLDRETEAGHVYAYALRHYLSLDLGEGPVLWESDLGPARYVSVE